MGSHVSRIYTAVSNRPYIRISHEVTVRWRQTCPGRRKTFPFSRLHTDCRVRARLCVRAVVCLQDVMRVYLCEKGKGWGNGVQADNPTRMGCRLSDKARVFKI